ncbi:MAG TPA: PHP-associated domain-containing protein [Acidimicrobiales bacterium]|nr:PHP-associated domain-containing protein [Acidimicrobiales bacterium]
MSPVKVDMHLHTMWSGDATTTPDELVEAVAGAGLDVVCITDHSTVNGALALSDVLPCRVVVGQESRTGVGELIGLFLTTRIPAGLKPWEFVAAVRAQGGLVYVPHPFDPMRHCLRADVLSELAAGGGVDVVEGLNAKTSLASLNQEAVAFAGAHGLAVGAGSDAHVPSAVGAAYVEMPEFDGPASFLEALAHGTLIGGHYDPPRPWQPRIVPSTKAT